ncbi:MAG: ComEC/Rec2 family competence protein [Acidobacteriaceae bacterium]|nr:ComEC/Rec2 family competence protein [Acidobacteriaceae bacterium]
MREPLVLPAAALAAGICAAHFIFFTLPDLAVPAALAAVALWLSFGFAAGRRWRLSTVCCAFLVAGMAAQVVHRETRTPRLSAGDGETVLLEGCVINPPVFSPNREQFTLELAPRAAARVSVALKEGQKLSLGYGERAEVAAKIRAPRNFQNPEAFDYAGYLAAQHIYWTGSASSSAAVHRLPGRCGNRARACLYTVRTWALDRLTSIYSGDPRTAALLQATLLGETSGVERRWTDDFRVTGTYHALVISGLHISIVALTLLWVLRGLRLRRLHGLWLAAAVCWLYACLAGFNSPAVRAAAGFTLFVVASSWFRRTRPLNLLAAIGLVYLVLDPDQLFDPAFQLSFVSVAVIAAFAIPLMERYTEPLRASVKLFDQVRYDPHVDGRAAQWRVELRLIAETLQLWSGIRLSMARSVVSAGVRCAVFVAEAVIVSACIQFGVALPMVCYFHRLSVTGLSANVILVPLLMLVVPLGFACIVTGWQPIAMATKLLLDWSEAIALWHVRFEPPWRIAALPLWIAVAFSVSLVLLAVAMRWARNRFAAPAALACSLGLFTAICLQPWKPQVHPKLLEVTAIDVSQGDSLLLVFPDGETMLVDAGGFPGMERMARKPRMDIGEDVVSPYLWSRRIHRLDYAVLTHGHSDHMGGLAAILDNFRPRALWTGAEPLTAEWKTVQQHAAADHVNILGLNRAAPEVTIGGARVRVLAPAVDYVAGELPHNNDSLVLEVTYGRRSVLLTGDAERPVEAEMLSSGMLEPVTLLKVGHHGSRTSSSQEFLDQVNPRFAFISDGYLNQFHHPHPDVLARFREHHTAVFRTDQRGLITFLTDGEKIWIESFR